MSRAGIKTAFEVIQGTGNARAEANLLGDAAGLTHSKAIIGSVEAAGLASAADDAANRARRVEVALNKLDKLERIVKGQAEKLPTSVRWLRRITKPVPDRGMEELWGRFSPRERIRLIGEMLRRADLDLVVIHAFVAGAIREMTAKHLSEIRRIVIAEKQRIRAMGKLEDNLSFIDTGTMGDVFLPTKILRTKGRSIELGTDRIIGIARGKPETGTFRTSSGEMLTVQIQGELEVTVAIEVKGRTTVEGGLKQVEALFVQGRATQGYAIIDGKFWLLKYDATKVDHVVVAAKAEGFDAVKGVTQLSTGGKLTVVEIPTKLDNQTLGIAGQLMTEVRDDLAAAGKVLRKAKRSKKQKRP